MFLIAGRNVSYIARAVKMQESQLGAKCPRSPVGLGGCRGSNRDEWNDGGSRG